MKRARAHIPYPERLAAALSMLLPQEDRDALRELRVGAADVIALFDFDHVVLHALGGTDEWHNLTPMLRAPHREKSRRDTSIVAKTRRLSRAHQEFVSKMLKPDKGRSEAPQSKWPKGRKLQSRNSFERRGN